MNNKQSQPVAKGGRKSARSTEAAEAPRGAEARKGPAKATAKAAAKSVAKKTAAKRSAQARAREGGAAAPAAAARRAGVSPQPAVVPLAVAVPEARPPVPAASHRRRRRRAAIAAAAVASLLGLCAAAWWQAVPQNPPGAWRPVNAVREGPEPHLLLAGHDVVAYFTRGLPQPGSPRFASLHQGVRLRFDNAEHQTLFEQDPQRYLPQFGGLCAQAMAHAKVRVADPRLWRIHEGRLYLFQDSAALQAFEVDRMHNQAQAHAHWDSEVRGTHSLLQSLRRLVD